MRRSGRSCLTVSGIGPLGAGGGELGGMRGVLDCGAAPATGAREMCRGLPFCWIGVAAVGSAAASAAAAVAEVSVDAVDLAWMVAEVCCARDALRDGDSGGAALAGDGSVVDEVVAESHRERLGRRKVGGRRVMGLRSSSAVRKSDLLILEAVGHGEGARDWRPLSWDVESKEVG